MYIHLPNAVTFDLHSEQCNFWSTSISVFQSRNDHSAQNNVILVCFKCTHSVCIVNRRIRLSQCAVPRYVFLSLLLCHLPPLHLKVFLPVSSSCVSSAFSFCTIKVSPLCFLHPIVVPITFTWKLYCVPFACVFHFFA